MENAVEMYRVSSFEEQKECFFLSLPQQPSVIYLVAPVGMYACVCVCVCVCWRWQDGEYYGEEVDHKYRASIVAQLVKNLPQCWRSRFDPWVGKIPWRRERLPNPVF